MWRHVLNAYTMWQQIQEFFSGLLKHDWWPARWHCGKWTDFHGWLYIAGDLLTWSAYFAIPIIILKFIFSRKNIEFNKIYFLFAAFILACGSTHFIDAVIFYVPVYRLAALMQFLTGVVSWITVIVLIKALPKLFALKTRQQLEEEVANNQRLYEELNAAYRALEERNSELLKEKEFIESVIDASNEYIVVFDKDHRVLKMNRRMAEINNTTKEDWRGKHFNEIFPNNREAIGYANLIKAMDSGSEILVNDYKSRGRYYNNYFIPLKNKGEVYAGMIIASDITDLKQKELSLAELNETFNFSEQISKIGSCRYNFDTGELTYTDNLYRLMGVEPGTFPPDIENFYRFVHPDDLPKVKQAGFLFMEKASPTDNNFRIVRPDGKTIVVQNFGKELETASGKILIGNMQDITATVVRERLMLEKNKALLSKNAELAQFTYVLSHDMKEPVRKVKTFLGMISEQNCVSEECSFYIERAQVAADRIKILMNDVLDYSKNLKNSDRVEVTDLNEVLASVKKDYELLITHKGAKIISDELPVLSCYKSQIERLFAHLLSNALKFTEKDPLIEIRCRHISGKEADEKKLSRTRSYIELAFKDNGIGFEQKYQNQIFDVFKKLHNIENSDGTGIGLATCKRIVENHHGEISVKSAPGEGATFSVILPLEI